MKVRFLMGYRHKGTLYSKGDTADLDQKTAIRVCSQGIARREEPETGAVGMGDSVEAAVRPASQPKQPE